MGEKPRRMTSPAQRLAQPRERRTNLVQRPRRDLADRIAIKTRRATAVARIVEQDVMFPHPRQLPCSHPARKPA
jgi:hypothetical protein